MRVLYIEDNPLDLVAFERFADHDDVRFDYQTAGSVHEGLEKILSERYDVVIADFCLPDGTALDILERISQEGPAIIILTGLSDLSTAVQSFKKGAYDYIVKDPHQKYLRSLPGVIETIFSRRYQVSQRHVTEQVIRNACDTIPFGIIIREYGTDKSVYCNEKFIEIFASSAVGKSPSGRSGSPGDIVKSVISDVNYPPDLFSPRFYSDADIKDDFFTLGDSKNLRRHSSLIRDTSGKIIWQLIIVEEIGDLGSILMSGLLSSQLDSLAILAGGIAHEFNNLLTSILGDLSMIRENDDGNKRSLSYLDRTEQTVLKGRDLTSRLLTYAKGGDPVLRPVNLHELMSSVVASSRHPIKLRSDPQEVLQKIRVDPDLIRIALSALVINAEEAIGNEGSITISTGVCSPGVIPSREGDFFFIEIRDDGPGMDMKTCRSAINPFYTTKEGHMGLGLTTTKSIAERHLGFLEIWSSPGEGTDARLILPFRIDENVALSDVVPDSPEKSNSDIRILIMDDEPTIQEILSLSLERKGFRTDVFSRGEDAVRSFLQAEKDGDPYHIVILDILIPNGMGGKETIRILREAKPSILAIVSSGYSSDPVIANCSEYGFDAALKKPYRPRDAVDLVSSLLVQE